LEQAHNTVFKGILMMKKINADALLPAEQNLENYCRFRVG
jgi:hypothetical protein